MDIPLRKIAKRFGSADLFAKFYGSSGAEKGAANLNDAAHVAGIELLKLTLDQTLPTLAHAIDGHPLIEPTAGDGANGRIHAGSATSTRQHRDVLHRRKIIATRPNMVRPKCKPQTNSEDRA